MCSRQSALESQVLDEKDKAQRLQTELDVSEQVQKDFVKLSQTLQVSRKRQLMSKSVVLNWWVATQKWVADPFSVGRGPLSGEGDT